MTQGKNAKAARTRGRPPRSAAQADSERARILKAAERLFAKDGYGGVSMRKVAKAAGCSPAALYLLFPHKRALLRNIWENALSEFDRVLARAERSARAPLARLKALGGAYVAFWRAHPDHFRALFMIEDRVGTTEERYFVDTSRNLGFVVGRFMTAAEGAVASERIALAPRALVEIFFCALHGVCSALIGMPEYRWHEKLAGRTVDSVLAGLPRA
jgi:AcrR family transcriptional regulator